MSQAVIGKAKNTTMHVVFYPKRIMGQYLNQLHVSNIQNNVWIYISSPYAHTFHILLNHVDCADKACCYLNTQQIIPCPLSITDLLQIFSNSILIPIWIFSALVSSLYMTVNDPPLGSNCIKRIPANANSTWTPPLIWCLFKILFCQDIRLATKFNLMDIECSNVHPVTSKYKCTKSSI